ncbi:MAG: hypothetical protein ACE5J5_02525 [Candidatus Hydrothermarchaeales archaeon]
MNEKLKFLLTVATITILVLYTLPLIPGFLKPVQPDDIVGFQIGFILVFLIADLILIGIPAWIHRYYVNDYSKIKNVKFFALFGGITGAILGEVLVTMNPANLILIIPYTILMFIYVQFYKRYDWWKVALTTYLGGIFVENIINRSPIQLPTLVWIAFFTYPYFVTKIWENRDKMSIYKISKDLKGTLIASVVLTGLVASKSGGPLVLWVAALPFLITILYRHSTKRKPFEKIDTIQIIKDLKWTFLASIILAAMAAYLTRNNTSPPLIVFGALLPFLVRIVRRK